MYAVIATGGKQYRVENGTVLQIEKLEAEPGSTVEFGEVLLIGNGDDIKVGAPLLKGGKVTATVEKHGKGEKKVIVKFRRRKHYLRQGALRGAINTTWGESLSVGTVAAGSTFSKSYSFQLSPDWKEQHCHVVAIIYNETTDAKRKNGSQTVYRSS